MKKSMNAKMDYNYFHRKTSVQTKTIGKKNYTYRFLVETLNKYKYKTLINHIQETLEKTPDNTYFIIENSGNKKIMEFFFL